MNKDTIYLQHHVKTSVLQFLAMTLVHTYLNSINEECRLNFRYYTAKNSQATQRVR